MKYGSTGNSSYKGCTLEHSVPNQANNSNVTQSSEDNENNKRISTDSLPASDDIPNIRMNPDDKVGENATEKSLNESVTTTSGFIEIESSQNKCVQDNVDISLNSTNDGDDDVPSLILDSDDDLEWDKCSSTNDELHLDNNEDKCSDSLEIREDDEFEMIKGPNETNYRLATTINDTKHQTQKAELPAQEMQEGGINIVYFTSVDCILMTRHLSK